MPAEAVKGPWFDIPAFTHSSQCRSCKAVVYWVLTPAGKRMPVDCDVDGGHEPTIYEPGHGVSHFSTCPDRDEWRKPR